MSVIIERLKDWLVRAVSLPPQEQAIALERWRRGQEGSLPILHLQAVTTGHL